MTFNPVSSEYGHDIAGTTANRPTNCEYGMTYFDTTINQLLAYGPNGWQAPGGDDPGVSDGLTAHSGGGQGSALALTSATNRVTTVAAQGDSVALPASTVGQKVTLINSGANAMQVFGNGTDTINGIATATGVAQGPGTVCTYVCTTTGNWSVAQVSLKGRTPIAISGSGAIPPHVQAEYVVTDASAATLTLAAPTATTDDGNEIYVYSNTTGAHTITATGLFETGTASVNEATFAAHAGAGLLLRAYQGKWIVTASVGITFS